MMLWYAESFMRGMVFCEKSVEQAVEFAFANETDVANLSWRVLSSRVWLPQGVAESMILDRKLIAKDVIVCH
jgi:hypothetical protein